MKKKFFMFIVIIFSLTTSSFLFAAFNPLSIPDSATIRENLYYTWFTRSLTDLRKEKSSIFKNEAGDYFQVSFIEYANEFAILCTPMDGKIIFEKGQGTWILYRDKKTEQSLRIEFYFTNNPDVFLVLKPNQTKTTIDLRVYNAFLIKDLHFALSFDELYALSFSQLYARSKNLIPWHYFTAQEKSYNANIQIVEQLRDFEDKIVFKENRAYDENGKIAKIFDEENNKEKNPKDTQEKLSQEEDKLEMSSLGYVKWLIDGLVYPQIASYLKIQALKKATIDTGNRARIETLSSHETVYAALDWTRNLAAAYVSVQLGRDLDFFRSGTQVNRSLFALSFDSEGYYKDSSYIENSGYSAHILKPLLYMLALTEPERLYIAAIKEFIQKTDKEERFDIGRYRDALVFLPYFDEYGVFQCPVFYAGKEISLEDLIVNSKNNFFSMVRIKTDLRFFPLKKE